MLVTVYYVRCWDGSYEKWFSSKKAADRYAADERNVALEVPPEKHRFVLPSNAAELAAFLNRH